MTKEKETEAETFLDANIKHERLVEIDEEILLADGFEDALLGYAERAAAPIVAAYDRERCIQIMIDRDGMTFEEAEEFFDFNVVGAYMGEKTPVFITILKE